MLKTLRYRNIITAVLLFFCAFDSFGQLTVMNEFIFGSVNSQNNAVAISPFNTKTITVGKANGKWFMRKINKDESIAWMLNDLSSNYSEATDVTIDNYGNIYITGYYFVEARFPKDTDNSEYVSLHSNGGSDVFVACYSPNGSLRWLESFGQSNHDIGMSLTSSDNVLYLAAASDGAAGVGILGEVVATTNASYHIIKMKLSGTLLESMRLESSNDVVEINTNAEVREVIKKSKIDIHYYDNALYATGIYDDNITVYQSDGSDVYTDNTVISGTKAIFIMQLDQDLNHVWTTKLENDRTGAIFYRPSIVADCNGVYVSGGIFASSIPVIAPNFLRTFNPSVSSSINVSESYTFLGKFSKEDGGFEWLGHTGFFNPSSTSVEFPSYRDICADNDGMVWTIGDSEKIASLNQTFIKYADGSEVSYEYLNNVDNNPNGILYHGIDTESGQIVVFGKVNASDGHIGMGIDFVRVNGENWIAYAGSVNLESGTADAMQSLFKYEDVVPVITDVSCCDPMPTMTIASSPVISTYCYGESYTFTTSQDQCLWFVIEDGERRKIGQGTAINYSPTTESFSIVGISNTSCGLITSNTLTFNVSGNSLGIACSPQTIEVTGSNCFALKSEIVEGFSTATVCNASTIITNDAPDTLNVGVHTVTQTISSELIPAENTLISTSRGTAYGYFPKAVNSFNGSVQISDNNVIAGATPIGSSSIDVEMTTQCDLMPCQSSVNSDEIKFNINTGVGGIDRVIGGPETINSSLDLNTLLVSGSTSLSINGNVTIRALKGIELGSNASIFINGNVEISCGSIDLLSGATIRVQNGSLTLLTEGDLVMKLGARIIRNASTHEIVVLSKNNIVFESGLQIHGLYYAAENIFLGNNSNVVGSLSASAISIGESNNIAYSNVGFHIINTNFGTLSGSGPYIHHFDSAVRDTLYYFENGSHAIIDYFGSDDLDEEGSGLSWTLSGTDASLFNIGPSSGLLSFQSRPDFEAPMDNDSDNEYEVVIRLEDSAPNSFALNVLVIVLDVDAQTNSCSSNITVSDSIDPSVTCANVSMDLDASGIATLLTTDLVSASNDNCGISSTVMNPATLTCSNLGSNSVLVTVTDDSGNFATCTSTVMIGDNSPPVSVCNDITVPLDGSGNATITVSDLDGGSIDNCSIINQSITTSSFDQTDLGVNTVNLNNLDLGSSFSSCTSQVEVVDNTTPIADCVDLTLNLDALGNASIIPTDLDGGSTDNTTLFFSATVTTFSCIHLGINSVELTVTDMGGNSDQCTSFVNVVDDLAPDAACKDITTTLDNFGNTSLSVLDIDDGSSDNCMPLFSYVANPTFFTSSDIGPNAVTLTVTDHAGNTDDCVSIVTIEDATPPIASCQDILISLDVTGNAVIANDAVDNGSSDNVGIEFYSTNITSFDCNDIGTNAVILTVTDSTGLWSICNANVEVADNIQPVVTCQDITVSLDISGNATALISDMVISTIEACPVTHTASSTIFNCNDVGNVNVTVSAEDSSGNIGTCVSTVTIENTNNPVASCQDITLELDAAGTVLLTPSDIDNGSSVTCAPMTFTANQNSFTCSDVGTEVVELTVHDSNGNTATCNSNVTMEDNIPPTMICQDLTASLNGSGELNITSSDINNGSSDACGISLLVLDQTYFNEANIGVNVVELIATDVNGNVNTCNSNVTIEDTTLPTALCVDITRNLDVNGQVSITANDINNGSFDNVGIDLITIDIDSFTCADIPSRTVTLTVTDDAGLFDACTSTVTISDDLSPDVTCEDVTATLDAFGTVSIVAGDLLSNTTDNCGIDSQIIDVNTFDCDDIGTNNVTVTTEDGVGNITTCVSVVTVVDSDAPIADLGILATLTDECSVSMPIAPTAMDNCGGSINGTTVTTFPVTNTSTITWIFTDVSGNSSTQTQEIVIDDVSAPLPNLGILPTLNDECSIGVLVPPTASDNCGATITGTTSTVLPVTTTTTITWTFTDVEGNTSTQTQEIIIDDVTAPMADIGILPDLTDECSVAMPTAPTATDNCGLTITGITSSVFPITATSTITWTYTDPDGNSSTQTQEVIINDVTAPIVDQPTLVTLSDECVVTTAAIPTATDNCGDIIFGTTTTNFPVTSTTTVTWTYMDSDGNTSSQTQEIIIDDVTAPVPDEAALTTLTDECSVAMPTPPSATDNCGALIVGSTSTIFPVTSTTTITWTFTDPDGNSSTQTQEVIIDDITAPDPDLVSLTTLTDECSVDTPSSPTATDNCGESILGTTTTIFPVTTTTTIIWSYSDASGNVSTQNQEVIIDDVTAPDPDIVMLTVLTDECSVAMPIVPTATDNCGSSIVGTTSTVFPVTSNTTITWTYTDPDGNSSTQTQQVVINDVTAPVADVTTLTTLTDECSVATPSSPTATDNCGDIITGTTTTVFPVTSSTTITWTYMDSDGNTSTQIQEIIIDDVTAPVADQPTLITLTDECSVSMPTPPSATDNCGALIVGSTSTLFPVTSTTTVTWTFTDLDGNTTTQTQEVIIDDVTAPDPDLGSLPTLTDECSIDMPSPPSATDNCGASILGSTTTTFPVTATTTIIWSYIDAAGNSSTQNQEVIIDDVTAPDPDNTVLMDLTDECSVAMPVPPTASDNCGESIIGATTTLFPVTASTTITWTFTDLEGNTSSQNQEVIINDVTAPVADETTLITLTDECSVAIPSSPTATDNCGDIITGSTTTIFPVTSSTTITWTYVDLDGNTSTQTQEIIIDDVTAPVADQTSLTTLTDECSVSMPTPPSATDNCGALIIGSTSTVFPVTSTTTITWTFTDLDGNISNQTQEVIINDVSAPIADLGTLPNLTSECSVEMPAPPTATDNCGELITGLTTTVFPVTSTTSITWTFTDNYGNVSNQTQEVIIDDISAPIADLTTLPTLVDQCGISTIIPPTATDNCGDLITGVTTSVFPITVSETILWTYTDEDENTSVQSQVVIIDDTIAPDAPTLDPISAECSTTLIAPTTLDNCAGLVTGTTTDPMDYNIQGTYSVNWQFEDGSGNITTQVQIVTISDLTDPVISNCPSNISVVNQQDSCGTYVSYPQVVAVDNCTPTLTETSTHNNGDWFDVGVNTQTYTFIDEAGNESICSFDIIVSDNQLPEITCVSDTILYSPLDQCSAVYSIDSPVVSDNCGIQSVLRTDGLNLEPGDDIPLGISTLNYEITDLSGNVNSCSQTIEVRDEVIPTITCTTDTLFVPLDENGMVTILPEMFVDGTNLYPRTDNCEVQSFSIDNLSGSGNLSFSCLNIDEDHSIDLIVYDNSGNSSSCSALVKIIDATAPELICSDFVLTTSSDGPTYVEPLFYLDTLINNCPENDFEITLTQYTYTTSDIGSPIQNTVTVTDQSGNVGTCVSEVTIISGESIMVCPEDTIVYLDGSGENLVFYESISNVVDVLGEPQEYGTDYSYASDIDSVLYNCNDIGINALTIGITNSSNYTASCDINIEVVDSIAPQIICPVEEVEIVLDENCEFMIVNHEATYTGTTIPNLSDNCSSDENISISQLTPGGTYNYDIFDNGTVLPIFIEATDVSGNVGSCLINYVLTGAESPTVSCSTDTILLPVDVNSCAALLDENSLSPPIFESCVDLDPVSNDLLEGSVSLDVGIYPVVWSVKDIFDQEISCMQVIEVYDNIDPEIVCPEYTAQCLIPELDELLDPEVSDNCTSDLIITKSMNNIGSTYSIDWIVSDVNGNSNSCTQIIEKVDSVDMPDAGDDQVLNSVFTGLLVGNIPEIGTPLWTCDGEATIFDPTNNETNVSNLQVGENLFYYQLNEDGCISRTDSIVLVVTEFFMPMGFSPNGDGVNDQLVITGILANPLSELIIFDRKGKKVLSKKGYQNDWGGTTRNGSLLPRDTYFYILEIPGGKSLKGSVEIKY